MKHHLNRPLSQPHSACGRQVARITSEVLEVNCKHCFTTKYYKERLARRLCKYPLKLELEQVDQKKQWTFEAFVQSYHPEQRKCKLLALSTWDGKPLAAELTVSQWDEMVEFGKRIWFSAWSNWHQHLGFQLEFRCLIRRWSWNSVSVQPALNQRRWTWAKHARQRQAERGIPNQFIMYALEHGRFWQEGESVIYQIPTQIPSHRLAHEWRHLKVVTRGRQIITMYVDRSRIPHISQQACACHA